MLEDQDLEKESDEILYWFCLGLPNTCDTTEKNTVYYTFRLPYATKYSKSVSCMKSIEDTTFPLFSSS